jgi:hypothetical protein
MESFSGFLFVVAPIALGLPKSADCQSMTTQHCPLIPDWHMCVGEQSGILFDTWRGESIYIARPFTAVNTLF